MDWNEEMSFKQLEKVRIFYSIELLKLEKVLKKKRRMKEKNCQHVWVKDMSARAGRSHYDCKNCGLYR